LLQYLLQLFLYGENMRYIYPDYYKKFSCVGGSCKDTCCAGWAVDIDDETAEMYKGLPLPIGDRLRDRLRGKKGGYYFELDGRRCPFLNSENLCDIISTLGEGGLCVTCTEYPRFYADTPIMEQVDLTLSCPEAARIFFQESESIKYIREDIDENEKEDDGLFGEDPFGKEEENDELFIEEVEKTSMDPKEEKRLLDLLAKRDRAIIKIEDRSLPLEERLMEALSDFEENPYGFFPDINEDRRILKNIDEMEVVNPLWSQYINSVEEKLLKVRERADEMIEKRDEFLDNALERFITYLFFRYLIDIYYHKDPGRIVLFIERCLRILVLILADSTLDKEDVRITKETIEERSRIFSRQIEHSDINVSILLK